MYFLQYKYTNILDVFPIYNTMKQSREPYMIAWGNATNKMLEAWSHRAGISRQTIFASVGNKDFTNTAIFICCFPFLSRIAVASTPSFIPWELIVCASTTPHVQIIRSIHAFTKKFRYGCWFKSSWVLCMQSIILQ